MKNLKYPILLMLLPILIMAIGCEKDEAPHDNRIVEICNAAGGVSIVDQVGRVYKWTSSEPHFYYIGNPQINPNGGATGGYIPCSNLPNKFQQEGLIITYSGIGKGALPDTGDPLFSYIVLSHIELSEE